MTQQLVTGHCLNPLPPDFGANRHVLLEELDAAYAGLDTGRLGDRLVWQEAQTNYIRYGQSEYERVGLIGRRWFVKAFWRRFQRKTPAKDPDEHLWALEALLTDFHEDYWQQWDDCFNGGGNVQTRNAGWPGLVKSGTMLRVAEDWHARLKARGIDNGFNPERLDDYITIDDADVPDKLPGIQRGGVLMKDERSRTAGQGSKTNADIALNQAEQVRATQVNLMECTPKIGEFDGIVQGVFELCFQNPGQKWSLALCYIEGQLHGVKGFPWATDNTWIPYAPIKKRNVERAVAASFGEEDSKIKLVRQLCANDKFVRFLTVGKKPTKTQVHTAIVNFHRRMVASTDVETASDIVFNTFEAWDRYAKKDDKTGKTLLEELYGIEPTPNMHAIGRKFYAQ